MKNLRFLVVAAATAATVSAMASPADVSATPANKEWGAWENRMPGVRIEPGKTTLLISGLVETSNGAIRPVLTHKGPREGEADALEIELTLEDQGAIGTTDINYRPVEKLFIVPIFQYKRVYILFEGDEIEEGPVAVRPAY